MSDKVTYTERRTITQLERLANTSNGNPRYRVFFDDRSNAMIADDSSLGYTITNSEYANVALDVTFQTSGLIGRADRIIAITVAR